jgi:hypothetical protein
MEADSTQPIATPVDRFEKFLASQNGCFPNERPCKSCAIAFAASETAALTQQVADLKAENAALVVARDAFDKAWTEEKAEVARLREALEFIGDHLEGEMGLLSADDYDPEFGTNETVILVFNKVMEALQSGRRIRVWQD